MSPCIAEAPVLLSVPSSGRLTLAAARIREERLHAELLEAARLGWESAWVCSVHRSWMQDAWDFCSEEDNQWWRYESQAGMLRNHLKRLHTEGHHLFEHEEDQVREVAAKLTRYAHALRLVMVLEKRTLG